jgi:hypothetical protein
MTIHEFMEMKGIREDEFIPVFSQDGSRVADLRVDSLIWKVLEVSSHISLENQFKCVKCGTVETKSAYCIAQNAMGHDVTYTCKCGQDKLFRGEKS